MQDPSTWDWDSAERIDKPASPGAVIAVRFSLAEISQLNDAADRLGIPLTQFIYDTVLTRLAVTSAPEH